MNSFVYTLSRRLGIKTGTFGSPNQIKRQSIRKVNREIREALREYRPGIGANVKLDITLEVES